MKKDERLFVNKRSVLRHLHQAANVPPATCQKASQRRKRLWSVAGEGTARFPLSSREARGPGPQGLGNRLSQDDRFCRRRRSGPQGLGWAAGWRLAG